MCVVSGGYIVRLHHFCRVKHLFPFQEAVAFDTGIGRLAAEIAAHKGIDNGSCKIADAVEGIKADAQCLRHPSGVVDLTASAVGAVIRSPGAQRHAAHFISFLFQEIGCYGAVHTSGHAD